MAALAEVADRRNRFSPTEEERAEFRALIANGQPSPEEIEQFVARRSAEWQAEFERLCRADLNCLKLLREREAKVQQLQATPGRDALLKVLGERERERRRRFARIIASLRPRLPRSRRPARPQGHARSRAVRIRRRATQRGSDGSPSPDLAARSRRAPA